MAHMFDHDIRKAERIGKILFVALNAVASEESYIGAQALQIAANKCKANAMHYSADALEQLRKKYL